MRAPHSLYTIWSLIGFVMWNMLLVISIVLSRGAMMRAGKKLNDFPSGTPHGSDSYWRLNRAHANLVENLPMVVAVFALFYAFASPSPSLAMLPVIALGARVVQSLAHISSGSAPAVAIRFTAFAAQYVCLVWMLFIVVRAL